MDDSLILQRFGLKVPKEHVGQVMAMMKQDPTFVKHIQKIKSSVSTMNNEDQFLQTINSLHNSISQIPQNAKVIYKRDTTYTIRAINPQNIKSMTQRAFFNSFNLQRNVLNDLEEQNKINRGPYRKQNKQRNNQDSHNQRNMEGQDQQKCICGKNIPESGWVQCSNQEKCRGSSWYHIKCAGFDPKDVQNLKDKEFICEKCKREYEEDQSARSDVRKRVKDDESG